MPDIVKALEKITAWLQNNCPEGFATLRPGLTREEIEEEVPSLGLPEEFYQLYQWKNGNQGQCTSPEALLFFGADFSPLKVDFLVSPREAAEDYNCIFLFSLDEYSLVLDLATWRTQNLQAPPLAMLWTNAEDIEIEEVVFTNITSMMWTLAEAFETGACWVDEEEWAGDAELLKQIHQKYNSGCEQGFSKWWFERETDEE